MVPLDRTSLLRPSGFAGRVHRLEAKQEALRSLGVAGLLDRGRFRPSLSGGAWNLGQDTHSPANGCGSLDPRNVMVDRRAFTGRALAAQERRIIGIVLI